MVADRWRLLARVRDMPERWLARAHVRLRRLLVPPGGKGRPPGQHTQASRRNCSEVADGADKPAYWLAACEDVRRLLGEALPAISRATCLAREGVRTRLH